MNGAAGWLQLDGLRAERWLAAVGDRAGDRTTRSPRRRPRPAGDAATKRCDDLVSQTKNAPLFERNVPDARRARRHERQDRRPQQLEPEPRRRPRRACTPGSSRRSPRASPAPTSGTSKDRYLASYVVVRDDKGDDRRRAGHRPAAQRHALARQRGDRRATARARGAQGRRLRGRRALGAAGAGARRQRRQGARRTCSRTPSPTSRPTSSATARCSSPASPLPAFEDGKRALLVAAAPGVAHRGSDGPRPAPIFGALAIGLVLVIVGGWLLGNYITRPINMLEEGLLAILNGQADKRFELDHAELGGLAFRIDQLLNQLMGVEEDTTDDEGRVSRSPSAAANFTDALTVDDKRMSAGAEGAVDPDVVRRLAAEPPAQYYARIYREYIAAKSAIGEPTDHITEQAFAARIQGMEQDAAQKYGRPVRYQVHGAQQRGRAPRGPAVSRRPSAGSAALTRCAAARGRHAWVCSICSRAARRQDGKARPKASPAAKWADRIEKRAQNYDRQEAIQAALGDGDGRRGRGAAQALHLPHGPVDHGPGREGRRVPRHPARRARGHRARARLRRQGREPRLADEDHEGARRRGRVRRGAPALAVAVGHRVRQVRRPEGADPRRARGAQAPAAFAKRSSASSRT